MPVFKIKNLKEIERENGAPEEIEARFARKHLDWEELGVSYFRYGPRHIHGHPPPGHAGASQPERQGGTAHGEWVHRGWAGRGIVAVNGRGTPSGCPAMSHRAM
jgi:hypothetical protein